MGFRWDLDGIYSLVISEFAMENGPVIVDSPIKSGEFQ